MFKLAIKSPTKIFKTGNSSAVRLSKDIMKAAGLKVNDPIDVTVNQQDGSVVIKPIKETNGFHDRFEEFLNKSMKDDQEALDFLKDK
ncbi:MAG: AbrB/MazE/SpoVT family DNA-binding domain-containing protein [Limosilactobacillus mucosae]